jgi:hypothetical protein
MNTIATASPSVVPVVCDRCGKTCVPEGCTPGYGETDDGKRHRVACCAIVDRERMGDTGRATLYLTLNGPNGSTVGNWPGTLNFQVGRIKVGRHNIARRRYDVWFAGPNGATWHGVTYGDNTQICHCRRIAA